MDVPVPLLRSLYPAITTAFYPLADHNQAVYAWASTTAWRYANDGVPLDASRLVEEYHARYDD